MPTGEKSLNGVAITAILIIGMGVFSGIFYKVGYNAGVRDGYLRATQELPKDIEERIIEIKKMAEIYKKF